MVEENKASDPYSQDVVEFKQLYITLREDVDQLANATPHATKAHYVEYPEIEQLSQTQRRQIIRSIFALIEAMSYRLKMLMLAPHRAKKLSSAEIALAREETYDLANSGEVVTRKAKLRTLDNIKFAFHLFRKVNELPNETHKQAWTNFERAIKIRDRLMHPKTIQDITVLDHEIELVLRSHIWFEDHLFGLLDTAAQKLLAEAKKSSPPQPYIPKPTPALPPSPPKRK